MVSIVHKWSKSVIRNCNSLTRVGGESLAVAQNAYTVAWFKGKELNFISALGTCFTRTGTTLGILAPQHYQGKSLLPVLYDQDISEWRDSFFCEHRMEHEQIAKYVGVRGQRYVYVNYYEQNPPYEYLHDLENDPDQLINLANNTEYKEILQKMKEKCENFENKLYE